MQNFLKNERVEPKKKGVIERIKNFEEIYERYDLPVAKTQAERCVQCGIPYCHNSCPLYNYIPQWLKLLSGSDLKLAFKISNESSPFPEIMGRVCPQDKLCEGGCTLNSAFGAITIGSIETFITEEGFKNGLSMEFAQTNTGKKVAVVGSGPAGLSVATFLLRAGVQVEMFEKEEFTGGLLTWGIPDFKLDKSVVARRVEILQNAGMKLHLKTQVGRDISFDDLRSRYDAVFLGIGAKKANSANIDGENAKGVYRAMDFLGAAQKRNISLPECPDIDVAGKTVVVIGGGDTAMDCVRTAIREGAAKAVCLYRRGEDQMPGSKKEYKNAKEEGASFLFYRSPNSILTDANSNVRGLSILETKLENGEQGSRGKLIEVESSEHELAADIVVMALGFSMEEHDFLQKNGINTDKWGQIIVDDSYETSASGVYAGGDCYRGANLVVNAALDGREAAKSILARFSVNS